MAGAHRLALFPCQWMWGQVAWGPVSLRAWCRPRPLVQPRGQRLATSWGTPADRAGHWVSPGPAFRGLGRVVFLPTWNFPEQPWGLAAEPPRPRALAKDRVLQGTHFTLPRELRGLRGLV